ncbi:MAG TPA: hypothetical protein VFU09_06080 [Candidatus Udaeobacter sp.]|nr:hypothetical protein [Candidatus Udaeobacter sp.]
MIITAHRPQYSSSKTQGAASRLGVHAADLLDTVPRMHPVEQRQSYYRNSDVRRRIREFIGADAGDGCGSEFLTGSDDQALPPFEAYSVAALNSLLEKGFEICRSLWDGDALIADFDIEYVNFDNPAEAFLEPEGVFAIQQPAVDAIERLLREYGIEPLHVLSGRGHHFIWRIEQGSAVFAELAEIGQGSPSLWAMERELHPPNGRAVPVELARAFAGLGLVMEFLAHRVKRIAAPLTKIPVELTALEVGPSKHGREMISIDISEYGDPLYARTIRVPFSVYLKPWQQPWGLNADVLTSLEPLFVITLQEIDWHEGISTMRDPRLTAKLAGRATSRIPDATHGTGKLLTHYWNSKLADFHAFFYSQEQHPAKLWPKTYDREPLEILPACVRVPLEQPNDLLLRPAYIRQLVRVMLALGWHPRHIAGLICSKYRRDFGWTQFVAVDPATRADFYTRVFAGLFAAGTDDLVDFNCISAQEQGLCTFSNCGFNLAHFRDSALERRAHDKLGHRPFNRLLLSSKHS